MRELTQMASNSVKWTDAPGPTIRMNAKAAFARHLGTDPHHQA